jgi:hypothetical protein
VSLQINFVWKLRRWDVVIKTLLVHHTFLVFLREIQLSCGSNRWSGEKTYSFYLTKESKITAHIKADSHIACHTHAAPLPFPCHAVPLIHPCHAAALPSSNSAVSSVKFRVVAGNIRTAIPAV